MEAGKIAQIYIGPSNVTSLPFRDKLSEDFKGSIIYATTDKVKRSDIRH